MSLEAYHCGHGEVCGKVMLTWNKVAEKVRSFSWLMYGKGIEVEKDGKPGVGAGLRMGWSSVKDSGRGAKCSRYCRLGRISCLTSYLQDVERGPTTSHSITDCDFGLSLPSFTSSIFF